jgi:hypothetical protein
VLQPCEWSDLLLFQRRAQLLTARGLRLRAEARRSRFGAYWRSRRRRVRLTGYAWIVAGIYLAAREAWLAHSAWYLASVPVGCAWLAAVRITWWLEKKAAEADGSDLLEGAEQIRWRLGLLPHVTSLRERLGMRAPCGIEHSGAAEEADELA